MISSTFSCNWSESLFWSFWRCAFFFGHGLAESRGRLDCFHRFSWRHRRQFEGDWWLFLNRGCSSTRIRWPRSRASWCHQSMSLHLELHIRTIHLCSWRGSSQRLWNAPCWTWFGPFQELGFHFSLSNLLSPGCLRGLGRWGSRWKYSFWRFLFWSWGHSLWARPWRCCRSC